MTPEEDILRVLLETIAFETYNLGTIKGLEKAKSLVPEEENDTLQKLWA